MKKICLSAILCCLCIAATQANIYYVTSNFASGTGSLADAITLANTHFGRDSIYFSISSSSVAGRTILIPSDSVLPNVADETVIDATTQPLGNSFGLSTSKIQIKGKLTYVSAGLVIDAPLCEVYGLWISHFATGVKLLADVFTFGKVNNGNVVSDCNDFCIKVSGAVEGSIVGAFIGVDTSAAVGTSPNATGIQLDNGTKKITIGGKQQNSRNVISGNYIGIKITGDSKFITIQGNYIGTDINGALAIANNTGILADETANNLTIGGDSTKYLNVISGNAGRGLDLETYSTEILGNFIGSDLSGTQQLGNGGPAIYFRELAHDNNVGGLNPGEGNVIAYNGEEAVYFQNPGVKNCSARGNRMFCNSQTLGKGGIFTNGGNQAIPTPTIVIVSSNFVSGLSLPHAKIDLYTSDSCTTCEGALYLATAEANDYGVFTFDLPVYGKLTATANDPLGNTSEFAECKDATNASCIYASFLISDDKVCSKENIYFTDQTITVPGSEISTWNWSFGDGQTSTQQNPSVSYSTGGVYEIILTSTNNNGCTDSDTASVTILDGVTALFSATLNVCSGAPASFSDASINYGSSFIVSWFWDLGDGSTSTFTDFVHTYPAIGDYPVILQVVNNNNCSSTYTDIVTVHDFPQADFSATSGACATTPIQFTDLSSVGVNDTLGSWFWEFGDGTTSTEQNASHLFTASGDYKVILTATDIYGCSDSVSHIINILAGAIANFTWQNSGLNADFTNTSSFNADFAVEWAFGDGTFSTLLNPSHTYNSFGEYEVCLTVNDYTCNQSDTLCQTIQIVTGINEVENYLSSISIYPNPANDVIFITDLPLTNLKSPVKLLNWLMAD